MVALLPTSSTYFDLKAYFVKGFGLVCCCEDKAVTSKESQKWMKENLPEPDNLHYLILVQKVYFVENTCKYYLKIKGQIIFHWYIWLSLKSVLFVF